MKLLAVGFTLGIAVGWLLSGLLESEPVTEAPRAPIHPTARVDPAPGIPAAEPREPAPEGPDDLTIFREGSIEALGHRIRDKETEYTDAEVTALIARVDDARARRDWALFTAALDGLGAAGTRAADEKLLALIRDETLVFKHRMGSRFNGYLDDCELPGIVDAARGRFLRYVEAGETSWVSADGWMELIVAKGDAEAVDWMIGLTAPGGVGNSGSGQIKSQVFEALAESDNPVAVERLADLTRTAKLPKRALGEFVSNHPEAAFPAILAAMDARPEDEDWLGETPSNRDLLRAFGDAVPENRLQEAKDRLLLIADEGLKIQAVYAVERLHRRGLDISGLESIVDTPVLYLERAAPPLSPDRLYEATYAIEYNRVAWSERSASAIEAAAKRFPEHSAAQGMVKKAKEVRAGLSDTWR